MRIQISDTSEMSRLCNNVDHVFYIDNDDKFHQDMDKYCCTSSYIKSCYTLRMIKKERRRNEDKYFCIFTMLYYSIMLYDLVWRNEEMKKLRNEPLMLYDLVWAEQTVARWDTDSYSNSTQDHRQEHHEPSQYFATIKQPKESNALPVLV